MSKLLHKAALFATRAHYGQDRKYTGEPYIVHPAQVATLAVQCGLSDEAVAAAWLHDVIEDTKYTEEDLRKKFPAKVVDLVVELTDQSEGKGNRKKRKALECKRLCKCSVEARALKAIDLVSNMPSIAEHDTGFFKVFLEEMRAFRDAGLCEGLDEDLTSVFEDCFVRFGWYALLEGVSKGAKHD